MAAIKFVGDLDVGGNKLLSVAAGSPAAPGFSFTGDADTGIYRPAANAIALVTAANERLYIGPTGYVGVNITPPEYRLDVRAFNGELITQRLLSDSNDVVLQMQSAATGGGVGGTSEGLSISLSSFNAGLWNNHNGDFRIGTNGAESLRLKANGNIETRREKTVMATSNGYGNQHVTTDVYARLFAACVAHNSTIESTLHIKLDVASGAAEQWNVIHLIGTLDGQAMDARFLVKNTTSAQSVVAFSNNANPGITVSSYNSSGTAKPVLKIQRTITATLEKTHLCIHVYRGGAVNANNVDCPAIESVTINDGTNI